MTVYLIYRGEKVVEVVRKIARVKFVNMGDEQKFPKTSFVSFS